ncbi:MAG: hypothetical protein LBP59_04870 [Planctomycetaceae bacterium]|nr:hypothetical protein [Planctomycetaceae bacterium]
MLQITIGLVICLAAFFAQSNLFAQNDDIDKFNESGAVILKKSIDAISRFIRVECNMRISTFVDGVEFPASGKYEEQSVAATKAPELESDKFGGVEAVDNSHKNLSSEFQRTMYRQELYFTMDSLSVQTEPNRIILACYPNRNDSKNGNIWQFRSINGNKTLHQINIDAVEAAIKRAQRNGGGNISGGVGSFGRGNIGAMNFGQVGMLWNVGGLAGVLGQVDRFYEFAELPKRETVDNKKAYKLVGSMRRAYFDLLVKNHGGLDKGNRYPSNLPCDIEVYIGVNDFFPYKIRYLNRKTENAKPVNLLLEINYENIVINGDPIPEHRFATFQNEVPAGVSKIESNTEQYIKSLGLE